MFSLPEKVSVLCLFISFLTNCHPCQSLISFFFFFLLSIGLPFPKYYIVELQCIAFSDWILSLSNIHLKFLHVFTWLDSSFLFGTDWYSIVWIYHSLFIWGYLGCFQVLAIMNKAVVNTVCGLPWWLSGKESTCQCRRCRFTPWVWKIPWRRKWQPTPVYLPGESWTEEPGLTRAGHDLYQDLVLLVSWILTILICVMVSDCFNLYFSDKWSKHLFMCLFLSVYLWCSVWPIF